LAPGQNHMNQGLDGFGRLLIAQHPDRVVG
jgi:hypothetical protein